MVEVKREGERYYLNISIPLLAGEEYFDDPDTFLILFDRLARQAIDKNLRGDAYLEAEDTVLDFISDLDGVL